MMRNQNGFSIVKVSIVIIVLFAIGVGAVMLIGRSGQESPGRNQTSVEGKVTQIVDQRGETCLTYTLSTGDNIVVKCPDMGGSKGFSGDYDKNIKVGDAVDAQGTLKTTTRNDRKTHHLDTPDSYLRLAE